MTNVNLKSFETIMHEAVDELCKEGTNNIDSGYAELDELISGFKPGELIIIAARPGMGKTAFALNISKRACLKYKILLFSLEMSAYSLGCRIISAITQIPLKKFINKSLDHQDWEIIKKFTNNVNKLNLYIDDSSYVNFDIIKDEISSLGDVNLIIIDYLQLIDTSNGASRVAEISKLTRSFKNLARELDVPIILLSQLSRACESRPDKRPTMSDLRDSGSIEQDADKVILIYREGYYSEKADPEDCEIIVAKNRSGDTGSINLIWRGECARFEGRVSDNLLDRPKADKKIIINQIKF